MGHYDEFREKDYERARSVAHYNKHPSGVECIKVVEHMNFNLGNAMKYIWRCGHKDDDIQDLEKALYYIQREINMRKKR